MKPLIYGEKSLLCEFRLKQGGKIPAQQHPQEQRQSLKPDIAGVSKVE